MGSNSSTQKPPEMNKYIANHQKIVATNEKVFPPTPSETKPLRSILKNRQDAPPKVVKTVELYVQCGKEWRVER
jgi:hypothetical protein